MAGALTAASPRPGGKPALPGATVADSAGGGMQAAMAIMAALVRRGSTGEGEHLDVSVADGVLSLMSLCVDEYLATGVVPGPGHNILTGRYACYDTYQCADGGWVAVGAIEPVFYRNLCRILDCEQWIDPQLDDDVQDEIRAAFRAAFAAKPRMEWLHALAPPTPASPRCGPCPSWSRTRSSWRAGSSTTPSTPPRAASASSARCWPAWTAAAHPRAAAT